MFVTANIPRMQVFIKVWINILYFIIFVYTFAQCFYTKCQVHAQFQVFEIGSLRNRGNPLQEALMMRLNMINSFLFVTTVFYLNQLIVEGIMPLRQLFHTDSIINKSQFENFTQKEEINLQRFSPNLAMRQELIELIYIVSIMIVFRCRVWPEFFESSLIYGYIESSRE